MDRFQTQPSGLSHQCPYHFTPYSQASMRPGNCKRQPPIMSCFSVFSTHYLTVPNNCSLNFCENTDRSAIADSGKKLVEPFGLLSPSEPRLETGKELRVRVSPLLDYKPVNESEQSVQVF